ncbi:hypothetical protein JG687_00014610 [Phytophthora cactorum]|uniref:RxLR effector protein n=1 Tax=Phytophthora cactorum TaxID=29920 RepID=A0A8T1TYX7_9STRA|nr:hypothetical protein PC120_g21530 [Phytophthora cactorum]KAG3196508.1 hypothetical protein PC128_g7581 [Phytophthora cactorum]KAG4059860.1 hypothetical protein PC123_g5221 [Phytophthora cactorum]KAG6949817.1 hypothetical protein JG687_00014610 [Phytophthora cactorum]
MKFLSCLVVVVLALAVSSSVAEETGVRARHILAMGDESILLTRGSLRRGEQSD